MDSTNLLLKKIGSRIRLVRRYKQIKQETLAKIVSLSKSEISRIENGKREVRLSKIFEIAQALGIKLEILLCED